MKNISLKNTAKAIIACLLWATAFVGIKIGLQYSQPLSFAGIRFMLAGILLMLVAGNLKKYFFTIIKNFKLIFLLSIIQTFLAYSFFYIGITLVDGALAAIIIGSSPLIVAILAHFFMDHDKMSSTKTLSLLIGIIGIIIISLSRKPWAMAGFQELIGIILLLVCTTAGSFGNIIVAKNSKIVKPIIFSSAQLFIGGFLILLFSIIIEGVPKIIYVKEYYFALAWLSFLSATSISIWFSLLKKPEIKVSELNLWKFIIPVFGAIFSWIILPNESPEISSIVGMLFVALSIILFNYFSFKEKKITSNPV